MATEPTSLALMQGPPRKPPGGRSLSAGGGDGKGPSKPTKKDRERYLLSRRGWTPEQQIARENLKNVDIIKDSIARYQLYRDSLAIDEQDLHISEMTSRLMPGAEKVLASAMQAKRTVYTGKRARQVTDHDTRLKAVDTMKAFMETSRPKGGGISINNNTQVNNGQGGSSGPSGSRGFDFEGRLRDILARKGVAVEAKAIDAEYEDGDEEGDELADELAELGIDLDEGDEETEGGQ